MLWSHFYTWATAIKMAFCRRYASKAAAQLAQTCLAGYSGQYRSMANHSPRRKSWTICGEHPMTFVVDRRALSSDHSFGGSDCQNPGLEIIQPGCVNRDNSVFNSSVTRAPTQSALLVISSCNSWSITRWSEASVKLEDSQSLDTDALKPCQFVYWSELIQPS